MEQNSQSFDGSDTISRIHYYCDDGQDVDRLCDQLRIACNLFKRGDEISITRDDNDVYVEGPDKEIGILEDGFWMYLEDEEGEY